MKPNSLAWIALYSWPFLSLAIFWLRRSSASLARTTAWMMLLPLMFLPAAIHIKLAQGIPNLDKHRLAFLPIALALLLFHPRPGRDVSRALAFPRLVFVVLAIGVVQTVRTNGDSLRYGITLLPALGSYDALSLIVGLALDLYVPFAVGVRVFRTERDVRDLFEVLTTCVLIYAPLAVVEMILSPQLHRWVYGYHQHEFGQMVRGTGFRPMIFMAHGLYLAMFVLLGYMATLALARDRQSLAASSRAGIVGVLLVACKSLAAILYGATTTALQLLLPRRALAGAALLLAVFVLAYPVVRMQDWLPRAEIVRFFEGVNRDRAGSLLYRFTQEELLLERARERPIYGWGSWGRNQVWSPWGGMITVADGTWILLLGTFGIVGFSGFFAMMLAPVLRFAATVKRMPPSTQLLGGTLSLMVAVSALDLLPNSRQEFVTFALAGSLFALAGRHGRPARSPGRARAPRRAVAVTSSRVSES